MKLFTIGHSNHSLQSFIALLKKNGITAIADVRSAPKSRYVPHFNRDALKRALNEEDIAYVFMGEQLGGRPSDPSCWKDNQVSYEQTSRSKSFQKGLERIRKGMKKFQIALLCSEGDPLVCHRFLLVSKHLRSDAEIHHILRNGKVVENAVLEQHLIETTKKGFFGGLEEAYALQSQKVAYRRRK